MLRLTGVNGLQMFGLNHAVIVQLLEQLQGAKYCRNYHFEYHTYDHRDNDEVPTPLYHFRGGRGVSTMGSNLFDLLL